MPILKASVHYGDFGGTAAADSAHQNDLSNLLKSRGLMADEEFVVGAKIWIGENNGGKIGHVSIEAIVATVGGYDNFKKYLDSGEALVLREIPLEISLIEFVALFKRFAVTLTRSGLELDGREYDTPA